MNAIWGRGLQLPGWLVCAGLLFAGAGCASHPSVDWNSRIGNYTFDQAVVELGPPDKQAKLEDRSVVAEWLTQRGYAYSVASYPYGYPWHPWYGPVYPAYGSWYSPDYYLRLVFDPDGKLKSWKKFAR